MKKLFLTLLLTFSVSIASADSFIDEITSAVGSGPEVNINLSTGIIKTMLAFADDSEARDASKIMKDLDMVRVSVYELDKKANTPRLNRLINDKIDNLTASGYEPIVTVKEEDEMVYITAKMKDHFLQDAMIIVMEEGDELVVISLKGLVDLAHLAQISDRFDVDLEDIVGL